MPRTISVIFRLILHSTKCEKFLNLISSGVYTSDLARGMRVSNAIRAGITFVNTYRLISPSAPFGGIKDSGYGKEAGIESIKDYTRVKTIWYYTSDEPTLDPFAIR